MTSWRYLALIVIVLAASPEPSAAAANGTPCADPGECASGYCVDGVCCNSACAGVCAACNLGGSVGACAFAAAGSDADGDCPQQEPSTCGLDGECNGAGACRLWPVGTECGAASCSGSVYSPAAVCDGAGACVDSGPLQCPGAYVCDGGGLACLTACASNADCTAGRYCTAGVCVLQKAEGAACVASAECASGYCVDGVCCDSACAGVCAACNLGGSVGTCVLAAVGSDPDGDCPQQEPSTCGLDGECDGAGACRLWPVGTECGAASCSGSVYSPAAVCDGAGACVDSGPLQCPGAYVCDGGGLACLSGCTSNADCTAGHYCTAGTCAAQMAQGATCASPGECASGYCVDGVCCDSACAGVCTACDLGGSVGTCGIAPATCLISGTCRASGEPNPANDCQQCQPVFSQTQWANAVEGAACDDGQLCTLNDVCGSGACSGMQGLPPGCDDGNVCTDDTCDPAGNGGAGACRSTNNIDPCDDANPCTSDDACGGGACAGTANTEPCPDGDVCNGTEHCALGACQSGIPLDCDDSNDCTADSCDPLTGCQHDPVAPGTPCNDPTDNPCTDPDTCSAGGVCQPNHAADGTPCNDNDGCTLGDLCTSGQCAPGSPPDCSDGRTCTRDVCLSTDDAAFVCDNVRIAPDACLIDDECASAGSTNPANECQFCDPASTQTAWTNKAPLTMCGEGFGLCDGLGGCAEPAVACPPVPRSSCHAAATGKAKLRVDDVRNDARDSLLWKWGMAGGSTSVSGDFGLPTASTSFALCIYDQDGAASEPIVAASIPSERACAERPCWRSVRDRKYVFHDHGKPLHHGIVKVRLATKRSGKTTIVLKGKGENLQLPGQPLEAPVLVQLLNSRDQCWQSVHSSRTGVRMGRRFVARGD